MKKKILFIFSVLFLMGVLPFTLNAQSRIFLNNLTIGSSSVEVADLQTWLESKGFLTMPAGVVKGYFGNLTQNALSRFQAAENITPAVGYFGPLTRASINKFRENIDQTSQDGSDLVSYYNEKYGFYFKHNSKLTPVELINSNVSFIGSPEFGVDFRRNVGTGWVVDVKAFYYSEDVPQIFLNAEPIIVNGRQVFKTVTTYGELLKQGGSNEQVTAILIGINDGLTIERKILFVIWNRNDVDTGIMEEVILTSFGEVSGWNGIGPDPR